MPLVKRAGVIGYPIGHSLSPTLFHAAFKARRIEATYEAWQTKPEELEARISGLRDRDAFGANVTIPHKETVVRLLDRVDQGADRVGAVNTIANEGGQLVGYNTDVWGFARSLREDAGLDPMGKRAAVLGAGGASRAVSIALLEGGASSIAVTGPIPEQLDKLIADLRGLAGPGVALTSTYWQEGAFPHVPADADLIVNCTPVGMRGTETEGQSPVAADHLPDGVVVFDLVYNPPETPLLEMARKKGARAVSGLGMLVYQAAESFRLWTGQEAPIEEMLAAGREALAAETVP
jgi:shikimate dehydrogenase